MKLDPIIKDIITRYLHQKETLEERSLLYQWFDKITIPFKLSTAAADESLEKARVRFLNEIGQDKSASRTVSSKRFGIFAACIIILLSTFISVKYIIDTDGYHPLENKELSKIFPEPGKATITLSTGQVIHLERRSFHNQKVKVGNNILEMDSLGQLTYSLAREDSRENAVNTFQTSKASQYSIILSDGTKVYLNASSKLSYPQRFSKGDRIVELEGEGYFEVTKTRQRSRFIVKTRGQSVEVLGTRFNISAYGNTNVVKTTLAEGSVRITPKKGLVKPILLEPNQQAILNNKGLKTSKVDAEQITKWRNGYFIFDGSKSDEVISEIGKWYGIEIEYNKENKPIEYEGMIPKNINLARLMELLNYAGIKVKAYKNKENLYKLIIN